MDCIQCMKRNAPYVVDMPDSRIDFVRTVALEWMEEQTMTIDTTINKYSLTNQDVIAALRRCANDRSVCDECVFCSDNVKKWRWIMGIAADRLEKLTADRDEYKRRAEAADIRRWEDFSLISAVWYGKDAYFRQDDGMVYSRLSGEYMTFGQAVDEFICALYEDN